MALPSVRAVITRFRAFLISEGGGAGLEFVIVAAAVGLALSATLYVVGGIVADKYEAVASALKRQTNQVASGKSIAGKPPAREMIPPMIGLR